MIEGIAAQTKDPTLIMFSDHGPRPVRGHLKPEEFLAGIEGLIFAGEDTGGGIRAANAAVVSNGRGSGKDPLGLDEIEGRVVSAQEMLAKTHDKPFPYPLQWLELLQAPCCGDVMIAVDNYAFFWDKPWVITTHGGPSRDEVGTSLLAIGPPAPRAGIFYGRQMTCGLLDHLYNSLRRILYRRPPRRPGADLFGLQ